MDREEFNSIIERITQNQHSTGDLEKLQSLQLNGDIVQSVSQDGKFIVDVGQISGGEIHIGDRVYHGADAERIRSLIEETLAAALPQASHYQRPRLAVAALVGAGVAAGITVIRLIGGLQSFELNAYDWLFKTKPFLEKPDNRIALVEITNAELNQWGTSEVSDRKLTQILQKLVAAQPFSIGVDIFRDKEQSDPAAPNQAVSDYRGLIRFLEDHQILVACQVDSASVPGTSFPSSKVPLSFSNVVVDGSSSDKLVRRQLLSMTKDSGAKCQATQSLGYKLALDYLKPKGITETRTDNNYIQLGNTVFQPVWSDTGGYRGIDEGGDQILLNYRRPPFSILTASQVLDGLDAGEQAKIKGRIVLVGYNETGAADPLDLFQTPLGTLPGVEIHAHALSHILSTVIDDDYRHPFINTWEEPDEMIWIVVWCLVAGILSWIARSRVVLLAMTVSGAVLIIAIAWSAFAFAGWWLPLVPALIGFVLTPITAVVVTNRKLLPKR